MINIKKIKYKNLLSVGNSPISYEFKQRDIIVVLGANGSAKSSINEALSFALFGKPYRKIRKDELINNINDSSLLVELDFSIGSSNYTVIRGIKPNIFTLYVNGEEVNQTSKKDLQQELESIINIDYNLFIQTVIIGCNYQSFFELTPQSKRKTLEELFGLYLFSGYQNFFKNKLKTVESKKIYLESGIDLTKNNLTREIKNYNSKVLEYKKKKEEYEQKYEELESSLGGLIEKEKSLESSYTDLAESSKKIRDIFVKRDNLKSTIEFKQKEINKKEKELKSFKEDKCPTCGSNISKTTKEQIESNVNSCIKVLNEVILNLTKDYQLILEESKTLDDTYDKKLVSTQNSLKEIRKEISNIRLKMKDIKDFDKLEPLILSLNNSIKDKKNQIIEDEKKLNEITAEVETLSKLVEVFSDTGIKKDVLSNYIRLINQIYNEYLQKFNFTYRVEINEDYECIIKSYNGNEFNYFSLSQGEKSRINLTMILTFRKLFSKLGKYEFDLLILDEVFDGALDTDGIDSLLNVLFEINSNVVLISHKEDIDNIECKKRMFKKVNGFTMEVSNG